MICMFKQYIVSWCISEHYKIYVLKYMNLFLLVFFSSWISMASSFKKNKIKLDVLTDNDMLLLVEKGIRRGISHSIDMQKLITNTWNIMIKINNRHILYSLAMLQKLSVNNFEWIKITSQFNEDFRKKYNGESDEGYYTEVNI